jgi:uncharacterized protein (TIGR02246 family)
MTPHEVVQAAADAYNSQDLERVAALFHPDVDVWWGGNKFLHGREAVVNFERGNFESWTDFKIEKTLHVANGDDLAVEWTCSFTRKATGKRETINGAEFWKLKDGQLFEWRAFSVEG